MKISLQKTVDMVYKHFSHDLGFMLLITGAVGWALSSLAHVTAVFINKDIPKEQKNFLIPQEIADAVFNIAAFIAITHQFNKMGTKLVESGRLLSKPLKEIIDNSPDLQENLGKALGKRKFILTDSVDFKNNKDDFQNKYYKFYDGIDFISATIGSIISCNIVTPLFRNIVGARSQKNLIMQDKLNKSSIMFEKPRITIDNYLKNATGKPNTMAKSPYIKI